MTEKKDINTFSYGILFIVVVLVAVLGIVAFSVFEIEEKHTQKLGLAILGIWIIISGVCASIVIFVNRKLS